MIGFMEKNIKIDMSKWLYMSRIDEKILSITLFMTIYNSHFTYMWYRDMRHISNPLNVDWNSIRLHVYSTIKEIIGILFIISLYTYLILYNPCVIFVSSCIIFISFCIIFITLYYSLLLEHLNHHILFGLYLLLYDGIWKSIDDKRLEIAMVIGILIWIIMILLIEFKD